MTGVNRHYLACDLGAESGRLFLGSLREGRLSLEEIHRFANTPVRQGDSLLWNIPNLYEEFRAGLKKAGQLGVPIASVSTDSWGVDYVFLDANGAILEPTYHYRDPRTKRGVDRTLAKISWEAIFAETGIQFMPLNTLFQLAAETPERLGRAGLILGIGDAFNFLLSGSAVIEESMASTFQLYNPRTRRWSDFLIREMELPREIFPDIVPSGTRLGPLRKEVAAETGLEGVEVIATCSHDTGAAVAAVPALEPDWAYLSSGTWSLMGMELREPLVNASCREMNFTNEIGYGGSVRLLKNIIGLWVVQECRRAWAKAGNDLDYPALTRLASEAPPFGPLINPADPRFLAPDDMPEKIAGFCRETGQEPPSSPGETIRCVLESLALLYRRTLLQLEALTGTRVKRVHIVGGGSKNVLLNQLTADALQRPILAGPEEATALGNVLIQAMTLGDLASWPAARKTVQESFPVREYLPREAELWDRAYERFGKLCGFGGG